MRQRDGPGGRAGEECAVAGQGGYGVPASRRGEGRRPDGPAAEPERVDRGAGAVPRVYDGGPAHLPLSPAPQDAAGRHRQAAERLRRQH